MNDQDVDGVLKEYLNFSKDVTQAFEDFGKELHQPIAEGKWTPYQILQHITDAELVYFMRVKRTIIEDNPLLIPWHPTQWIEMESKSIPLETNFCLIGGVRKKLFEILVSLTPDQWERKVIHPRYGEFTLLELIRQQTDHADSHLNSIL